MSIAGKCSRHSRWMTSFVLYKGRSFGYSFRDLKHLISLELQKNIKFRDLKHFISLNLSSRGVISSGFSQFDLKVFLTEDAKRGAQLAEGMAGSTIDWGHGHPYRG